MLAQRTWLQIWDGGWGYTIGEVKDGSTTLGHIVSRSASLLDKTVVEHWVAAGSGVTLPDTFTIEITHHEAWEGVPQSFFDTYLEIPPDENADIFGKIRREVNATFVTGLTKSSIVIPAGTVNAARLVTWNSGSSSAVWLEITAGSGTYMFMAGPSWASATTLTVTKQNLSTSADRRDWAEEQIDAMSGSLVTDSETWRAYPS